MQEYVEVVGVAVKRLAEEEEKNLAGQGKLKTACILSFALIANSYKSYIDHNVVWESQSQNHCDTELDFSSVS